MNALSGASLEARVLHESAGLLVLDKPPGLPTSGRRLTDTDCLQHALIERHGDMVWAVHQLDADTSGVNLFCTERSLVEPLKRAMRGPRAEKRYWALVHGAPHWERHTCREPIGDRPATTHFEVRERLPQHTRLGVRIESGRTHQIRVHLAHLGHALVGEEWYRSPPCRAHPRQALHAERLRLAAPFELELVAPLPEDLVALRSRCGG